MKNSVEIGYIVYGMPSEKDSDIATSWPRKNSTTMTNIVKSTMSRR